MRAARKCPAGQRPRGFTLVEILVTLLLIGLLIAVVVPSVINQAAKGEVSRVAEDLEAVRNAARLFRIDVGRWPGQLQQLVQRPASGATDVFGATIPDGLLGRWNGPYLETGTIPAGGLETALGGVLLPALDTLLWGNTAFLGIRVVPIGLEDARRISALLDGDTITDHDSDNAGRVRWHSGGGTDPDTLLFLGPPVE